ncbi:MAG: nitroreductase family protein [Rhodospirillales bacterium]|nr:nitroreductase family protein [Rhodospirillales bacterium]
MASTELYDALVEVCRDRRTSREFDPDVEVPREHFDMIFEAARHAPSGANTQPWHYVVVTEPEAKAAMADYFIAEASRRAKLGMKFPTPNYRGLATAPGVIVVIADFRWINAFPVLNDGSELDALYKQNAERILLQSVAASTMSAHLAAAALGYGVWWVTAIGQENAQSELKPLLGVPEDLAIIDIVVFGKPLKPPYKRWKKTMDEIRSFETYNADLFMDQKAIETWIKETRHKVMFRDESRID